MEFDYEGAMDLLEFVRQHVDNIERALDPHITDTGKSVVLVAVYNAKARLDEIAKAVA